LFDANQSVFLTLLCDNVGRWNLFTKIDRKILLKTWFTQFGIFDYWFFWYKTGRFVLSRYLR
jgi:hypothetical protein